VATLHVGQVLHELPINGDNTLGTLGSRYQRGFFAGVAGNVTTLDFKHGATAIVTASRTKSGA